MSKTSTKSIPKIQTGTPEFDNMVFCLSHPLDKKKRSMFNFNGFKLHELEHDVYALPVRIAKSKSLFMIFSPKIMNNIWIAFYCLGHVNMDHEVITFDLKHNSVMTTGKGLNYLGQYDPKRANQMLKYFKSLSEIREGSWHELRAKHL